MNILLAVSRGSANEAQLIVLEHAPAGHEDAAPLVLVGKGITFDTGGISIKPSERMEEMKHDMSGAAAVVGAMQAIALLGVPRRVIGVAACVENMPDGNAFRPGDILTGMTGKSTEILSTDAEGTPDSGGCAGLRRPLQSEGRRRSGDAYGRDWDCTGTAGGRTLQQQRHASDCADGGRQRER
jgi:hypothetical protein